MQRQSLGSPGSKLHNHGVVVAKDENLPLEDQKRKDKACSLIAAAEDSDKSQKPQKSPTRPEKFIHFIPILTVICFLVLYLSSHAPSQHDLEQFNGFQRLSKKHTDSTEVDDFDRVLAGDVLAIRSLRNLQEIGRRGPKIRPHRKIGDF